jgi:putative flavoprotein involved in K+ transport
MLGREADVLITGAGQAGLGAAYWLRRMSDLDVLIIDRSEVGSSWLTRWDSLRLFTPRRFSALPGMRFPPGDGFPTRIEVAEYLRRYAERFGFAVQAGHEVQRLTRWDGGFSAETDRATIQARHVVLASGPFTAPHVPEAAAAALDAGVAQLHSGDYRRPADVPDGDVVVVGGGNSAAQLALELTDGHRVTVVSPREPWFLPERMLGVDLYWWLYLCGTLNANAGSPISRFVRRRGDAIIGTDLRQAIRAGRIRLITGRVTGADGQDLVLTDGSRVRAETVLWCTGFRPNLSWLDVPGARDTAGEPLHRRGASPVPGLHWMGLPWQTRLNSSIINGVDRDARATAKRVCRATESGSPRR